MSFQHRVPRRASIRINPTPGEIWHFKSIVDYPKFHLCVSFDGHFLFMNSPKPGPDKGGNFYLPEEAVRRLPRNTQGISIVSCTTVVKLPDNVILTAKDSRGSLLASEMLDIAKFIETKELIERGNCKPWLGELIAWAQALEQIRLPSSRGRDRSRSGRPNRPPNYSFKRP